MRTELRHATFPIMFKWFAILAMVTAALALGQDAKQKPPTQADQQQAPIVNAPNGPGISVDKLPVISVERDWVDKTALVFSLLALLFTGTLVLIGVFGIRSANKTLQAIERQVAEMISQTRVNEKIAEVARINAEAVVNSERSLILVSHDAPSGPDKWSFTFKITNYGRSPAEILWTFFEPISWDRDETLPEWPIYERPERPILVHREWVPPGGNAPFEYYDAMEVARMVPGLQSELLSGKKKLWLYGVVRYRDKVSSEEHETRFCYWKSPAPGVNLLMGGPSGYNDVT
jgi:hypothetical protein